MAIQEAELQHVKPFLGSLLSSGTIRVKFQKTNGDMREMLCTQKLELIPEDKRPKGDGKYKSSPEVCSVWDVEAEGWRSFRYDSVKSVHFSVLGDVE